MLYFCHYFTQNGRKSSIFTLFTNINLSTYIAHRLAHVQKRPCRWLGGSRLECPRPEMLLLGEILKFLSLRPRAADRPWLPGPGRGRGKDGPRARRPLEAGPSKLRVSWTPSAEQRPAHHRTDGAPDTEVQVQSVSSLSSLSSLSLSLLSSLSGTIKLSVCKHTIISSKHVDSKL